MKSKQEIQQSQNNLKDISSENIKIDDFNFINTQQEDSIDRNRQRQLFECRFKEIEEGLQGDQTISENSFLGGNFNIFPQDIQINSSMQSNSLLNRVNESQKNSCRRLQNEEVNDLKIIFQDQAESKDSPNMCQESNRKQDVSEIQLLKIQSNIKNDHSTANQQSVSQAGSSISIQSKIKVLNQKNQQNIQVESDLQQQSHEDSKLNIRTNKNIGWIQEQVIYEKNQNQIKRMVTRAVKDKQQQKIEINSQQRKSQQNIERAQIIINRLLNNSMSRMMRVRQHVHNFVYFLKLKYMNRRSDELTYSDYPSINDLCIYHKINQEYKNTNCFILKIQELLKSTSKIPVFMPTDSVRVVWDLFQVFFTYIFLYFYSILMFYAQDEKDSSFIQEFFFYAFLLFIIDILINFNTAYFDKDIIVKKRKQIAKQYILSTLFLTDCISLMVLGSKVISQSTSIVYNPSHNMVTYFLNILIFLKANGMSPKKKRFDYVFTLKENQKHVIKLINQLVSVITVAHIGIHLNYLNQVFYIIATRSQQK